MLMAAPWLCAALFVTEADEIHVKISTPRQAKRRHGRFEGTALQLPGVLLKAVLTRICD
jgi:hypothetical protein